MQVGSIVETVTDFEEVRRLYGFPYPRKGDILTVSHIDKHHNKKCRKKGMVLLYFEEILGIVGVSNKKKDGTHNFLELQPPMDLGAILEKQLSHKSKQQNKPFICQTINQN